MLSECLSVCIWQVEPSEVTAVRLCTLWQLGSSLDILASTPSLGLHLGLLQRSPHSEVGSLKRTCPLCPTSLHDHLFIGEGRQTKESITEEGQGPNLLSVAPKSSFTTLSTLSTTGQSCIGGDRSYYRDKGAPCLGQETAASLRLVLSLKAKQGVKTGRRRGGDIWAHNLTSLLHDPH